MRILLFLCNQGNIYSIDFSIMPIQPTSSFPLLDPNDMVIIEPAEGMMVMNRIIEAKERAERFLFWVADQKWADTIKDTNSTEFKYNVLDWPFRFEAYAYLGHRYKKHIRRFAQELKALWSEWVVLKEKQGSAEKEIFWQLDDVFPLARSFNTFTFSPLKKSPFFKSGFSIGPDVDVDMLVSMYRAKEILGIEGFDNNFTAAARMFIRWLLCNDITYYVSHRTIWQISRSPALRAAMIDHIRLSFAPQVQRKIADEEEIYEERCNELKHSYITDTASYLAAADVYLWAEAGFFFLSNDLGSECSNIGNKAAFNLVERQREDGSFNDDVITTCLAASCIHLAGANTTAMAVNEKAVEWLLQRQDNDGSWSSDTVMSLFEDNPDWTPSQRIKVIADRAQTTVIVLETIDLIKKIEPLPIWSVTTKGRVPRKDKEPHICPFSIPEGSSWSDVCIRFLKRSEDIDVKVGKNPNGVWNFAALGFTKKKAKGPDIRWELLKVLAGVGGEISWENKGRSNFKKNISLLRIKLKELFVTEDDPFCPYQKCRSYKARFTILPYVDTDEDIRSESETLNSLRDDIEKKELMHHRKIQSANYREIKGLDREEEDS